MAFATWVKAPEGLSPLGDMSYKPIPLKPVYFFIPEKEHG
jgi:hypothetical protein